MATIAGLVKRTATTSFRVELTQDELLDILRERFPALPYKAGAEVGLNRDAYMGDDDRYLTVVVNGEEPITMTWTLVEESDEVLDG